MNLIQFLAMKLHQGPLWCCGEFKRGRSLLQNQFREGRPKSVLVSETIDAVRQLILQDHHVTYRQIETTLFISGPIYIQYCMNIWLPKKFTRFESHTICQSLKKKINQSECFYNWFKSVQILMGNILKNNKVIFDD